MREGRDQPSVRAVVRDGRLTLNPWRPWLLDADGLADRAAELAETGTAIVDLTLRGDAPERELEVRVLAAGDPPDVELEAAVLRWATLTGYRRVWFPWRLVELPHALLPAEPPEITCPTCGLAWREESEDGWAMLRRKGYCRPTCDACNGSLPEWAPGGTGDEGADRNDLDYTAAFLDIGYEIRPDPET